MDKINKVNFQLKEFDKNLKDFNDKIKLNKFEGKIKDHK